MDSVTVTEIITKEVQRTLTVPKIVISPDLTDMFENSPKELCELIELHLEGDLKCTGVACPDCIFYHIKPEIARR